MSAAVGTEDRCVHQLFAAQVARTPFAVALIDGDLRLTYREVDQRTDHLAKSLRASGVTVESAVGVCCDPSADMVVALLAVLKAGGAYVPLDPASPRTWRESILADARVDVVLTHAAIADRLAYRIWVEAPDEVRLRRGLERDGENHRELWLASMTTERQFFAHDATRTRADLRVNGNSDISHDQESEVVLLE